MATNNNINYGPAPIPGAISIPVIGNNIDRAPGAVSDDPAIARTTTAPVLGNNIDRAPAAVQAGPAIGINPLIAPSVIPVTEQAVDLLPENTASTVIPVVELAVEANIATPAGENIPAVNQQRYITILANGAVVTNNASTLNFAGNGFTIANLGTYGATITISAEAGGYGNSNVAAYLPTYTGNFSANNIVASNVFTANTVTGTNIYATIGSFSGEENTGDASLYIGSPTFTDLGTDVMAQFTGNVVSYGQINFQNYSNSPTATGDYIATADNGTDSTHYIDLGITSSTWDGTQENSLGNALSAGDGYLYVQDGNLALAVKDGEDQHVVKLDLDGNLTVPNNMVMQTAQTGFPFSSNIVGITTGETTVQVLLAASPFPGPVTGQVYIAGVVGTTEANDTWWFQANESDSIELFTDSTFSTPVDGTTWTAYENGGFAVSTGSADLEIKGGNVSITGGAWSWTFDAAGNLSLPGGGAIVNQDNTSILITNENVQDGEITLAANTDVNLYGGSPTTPTVGGGRVSLAGGDGGPDSGDGVGYGGWVEITGGTGAPAINGAAGGGGEVRIVGGLGGAANSGNSIPAEVGGTVYIFGGQSGDVDGNNALAVNGTNVEIHGGLGSFNGSTMVGIPGDVITQGGGNGWIGASGNVLTKTSPDGYDFYVWKYDNAGRTIYPTLSTQRGDTTGGTISGYTIRIGDGAAEAIITTPDGVEGNEYSQRLVINPGAGSNFGEGGDIYLWAGRGGDGSGSGGDIKIRGGQGGANTNGGTGGAGGYIRMEAGDAASVGGDPGYIEITAGSGGSGSPGGYVHILAGTGATGGGEANLTGGYAQNGLGGQVNITGGISADGLGSYGNVVVSAGASGWTFDNTGNLTFPNGDIITNGAFNGTASSTVSLNAFSPDGNAVSFQAQGNTSNAVIQTYSDATATTYSWTFDNFGITTFPDNTLATNNDLTIQTPNGVPGAVTAITGSSGSWESNPVTDLATTGGTGSGLTVNVTQEGGYAGTIAIATPGTGYSDGDTITVTSGSSNATFTISVLANSWVFGTDGNFALNGSNIAGATNTVVNDGINSITLGAGATMDVYGFPFSGGGVRGQLTITGDITTTQALGTWYYQSTGTYIYQLYTDSTYSTLVDASGWTAYTGGGSVAITKQNPASNVVIDSNGYFSVFGTDGTLDLPGDLNVVGNITGNTAGYAIGYRDIPQISFTGNATIATTSAGKHYYSTQSSNFILTIANNASQGLQVGSAITIVNQGTGTITVAQGSGVTLYIAGNATSGNRSISTFGMATLIKVATDTWFINGTGVS